MGQLGPPLRLQAKLVVLKDSSSNPFRVHWFVLLCSVLVRCDEFYASGSDNKHPGFGLKCAPGMRMLRSDPWPGLRPGGEEAR